MATVSLSARDPIACRTSSAMCSGQEVNAAIAHDCDHASNVVTAQRHLELLFGDAPKIDTKL